MASSGTTIGQKGINHASKFMSLTAMNLLQNSDALKKAKEELNEQRGADFVCKPLFGD